MWTECPPTLAVVRIRAPSGRDAAASEVRPVTFALGHTDAWHGDRLKEVRGGDHGGRIRGEAGLELRMREGGAVMGRRLPHGVVQIGRAVPDGAVKLSRDEPRLPLHEGRVVLPGLEETWLIGLVQRDQVHEDDGGGIDRELSVERKRGVEGRSSVMTGTFHITLVV
jgi:hypothetical protein